MTVLRKSILNGALCDVQDKVIIDHEFISGIRVLTAEEIQQAEDDKLREEAEESSRLEEEAAKTEITETEAPDENGTEAPEQTETPDAETPNEDAPATDDEKDEEDEEIDTDNIVDNGKIVKVTYEGGKVFILNYNNFKVNVDGVEIDALGFYTYTEGGEG